MSHVGTPHPGLGILRRLQTPIATLADGRCYNYNAMFPRNSARVKAKLGRERSYLKDPT